MKVENDTKYDFTDVLIRPKRSTLSSRSEVNLVRDFKFKYSGRSWSGVPIISSNMDSVSNVEVFKVLSQQKCLTCFHKYINIDEVISACKSGYDSSYFMLSTGITEQNFNNLKSQIQQLADNQIDTHFICIDVANGYMFSYLILQKV